MLDVPVWVLTSVLLATATAVTLTAGLTGWYRRALACRHDLDRRVRELAPVSLVLLAVLALNAFVRPRVDGISPAFGVNATDAIYALEGQFVHTLQEAVPKPLVFYFAGVYVVGYALLLVFPPLAYAVLDDLEHAASLLLAYALNYLVGALLYVAVVAYGPRNWQVEEVGQPLYTSFPDVQYLTSAVNTNSNVFPSLHASLAVTVLLFAYTTRREYPRWFVLTGVLAPSVVLATMVLGIHWLTDVVAGVALAVLCVWVARRIVTRGGRALSTGQRTSSPLRQ